MKNIDRLITETISVAKGIYEAAQEILSAFLTQNLAIEPLIDVLPAPLMGRDGKTPEGYGVYSETDSWFTKQRKSIKHGGGFKVMLVKS